MGKGDWGKSCFKKWIPPSMCLKVCKGTLKTPLSHAKDHRLGAVLTLHHLGQKCTKERSRELLEGCNEDYDKGEKGKI